MLSPLLPSRKADVSITVGLLLVPWMDRLKNILEAMPSVFVYSLRKIAVFDSSLTFHAFISSLTNGRTELDASTQRAAATECVLTLVGIPELRYKIS